jgi:hypothetical protein
VAEVLDAELFSGQAVGDAQRRLAETVVHQVAGSAGRRRRQ